jgi:hypothetical protein
MISARVFEDPERMAGVRTPALAHLHVRAGRTAARSGDLREARRMFARAIRLTPFAAAPYFYFCVCNVGESVLVAVLRLRHLIRSTPSTKRPAL